MQHLVGRWGASRRRPALLRARQRAEHLALDASRRASDRRDDGRGPTKSVDFAARSRPSTQRAHRRSRGVGLERLLLQRLRPAVRQRARLGLPPRSHRPRRRGLPAVAARQCASVDGGRTAPPRRLHPALLPAGRRVQRRHLDGDAAAAQPIDALALGSELRRRDLDQRPRAADPAPAQLGEPVLPRHADRDHRIQLGRRTHQRRHRAGRRPRHLRPRGPRHGHRWTTPAARRRRSRR